MQGRGNVGTLWPVTFESEHVPRFGHPARRLQSKRPPGYSSEDAAGGGAAKKNTSRRTRCRVDYYPPGHPPVHAPHARVRRGRAPVPRHNAPAGGGPVRARHVNGCQFGAMLTNDGGQAADGRPDAPPAWRWFGPKDNEKDAYNGAYCPG
jgi:hypothetical protein